MTVTKEARPFTFGAQHDSPADVLESIGDDEFSQAVADLLRSTELANTLAILRNHAKMTQAQVAEIMGCQQAKISKIEASLDERLTIGDILLFATATGFQFDIIFRKKGSTIVDDIEFYAHCMKRCFDRLAEAGKKDAKIAAGVTSFCKEALFNLVKLVGLIGNPPNTEPRPKRRGFFLRGTMQPGGSRR